MVEAVRGDDDAIGPDGRILIVGGGMAGSLLALVLGRAGHAVSLIDLNVHRTPGSGAVHGRRATLVNDFVTVPRCGRREF
ncbi:MAG TPA: hypothetical protein VHZ26_01295 [Caulobacteraceae bacterium]|nr:hypothetical protein [Caulobacteraceae bacterium]